MTIQYTTDSRRNVILVRMAGEFAAGDLTCYFQVVHPGRRLNGNDRLIVVDILSAVMPGWETA